MKKVYTLILFFLTGLSPLLAQSGNWKANLHFSPLFSTTNDFEDYDGFMFEAGVSKDLSDRITIAILPYYAKFSGENYRYIDPRIFALSAPYLDSYEYGGINAEVKFHFTSGIVRPYVSALGGIGNTWYTSNRYEAIVKENFMHANLGGGAGLAIQFASRFTADIGFQANGFLNMEDGKTIGYAYPSAGIIFAL